MQYFIAANFLGKLTSWKITLANNNHAKQSSVIAEINTVKYINNTSYTERLWLVLCTGAGGPEPEPEF